MADEKLRELEREVLPTKIEENPTGYCQLVSSYVRIGSIEDAANLYERLLEQDAENTQYQELMSTNIQLHREIFLRKEIDYSLLFSGPDQSILHRIGVRRYILMHDLSTNRDLLGFIERFPEEVINDVARTTMVDYLTHIQLLPLSETSE